MELAKRWVGAAAIGAALLIGLSAPSAQAAYVVDLTQQGSDVVATGRGRNNRSDRPVFLIPLSRGTLE